MATNSNLVRRLRSSLTFNTLQQAVLIGSILGDGHLSSNITEGRINSRLQIAHSEKQRTYVFWKYRIFSDWVLSPPKYVKANHSWRFRTLSHPELTAMRSLFYFNRKKIIPLNIDNILIKPLSLAVWIMDDGFRKGKKGLSLCTHSFSPEEVGLLRDCLYENFGLESTIHWDGKGHEIHFPSPMRNKLLGLVGKIVIPSLQYKLPIAP